MFDVKRAYEPMKEAPMAQRSTALVITLHPDEHARIAAVAEARKLPMATWARAELLRIADKIAARRP